MALLIVTALIVGKSAEGYPNGGVSGGDEWAEDSIANGCSCHMDEQLNEGMYSLKGIPNSYLPTTSHTCIIKALPTRGLFFHRTWRLVDAV